MLGTTFHDQFGPKLIIIWSQPCFWRQITVPSHGFSYTSFQVIWKETWKATLAFYCPQFAPIDAARLERIRWWCHCVRYVGLELLGQLKRYQEIKKQLHVMIGTNGMMIGMIGILGWKFCWRMENLEKSLIYDELSGSKWCI